MALWDVNRDEFARISHALKSSGDVVIHISSLNKKIYGNIRCRDGATLRARSESKPPQTYKTAVQS